MRHGGLTRRQAMLVVTGVIGTIYAEPIAATPQGRTLLLPLDDVAAILVRYRGRTIAIQPQEIIAAVSGKEE